MNKLKDQSVEINETSLEQRIHVDEEFLKIICPCRILIVGSTLSGALLI